MSHLMLSLLGPLQATLDGRLVTGFRANKVRALLAYLAGEADRPHYREALAGLLWPDCPDVVALGDLRSALSNLRKAIGDCPTPAPAETAANPAPHLLITRDTIQFNTTSDCWVDMAEFEQRLVTATSSHVCDPPAEIDVLERAISLYRGSFLEGFSVEGSPAFEDWLLLRRERHHRQMCAALHRLTILYEQLGEWDRAIGYARRQLELESWDEEVHRRVMTLLALSGHREGALAQYQTCRRVLAAELGIEPAGETTALYKAIRAGTLRTAAVVPHPAGLLSSPELATVRFVAREEELAGLNRHLDVALKGGGHVVFVTGEAGSGKTALLAEFARLAMQAHGDLIVIGGNCSAPGGLGDPYLPFRKILQLLSGDVEARLMGGAVPPELARRLWNAMPTVAQALVEVGHDLLDLFVSASALARRADALVPAGVTWRGQLDGPARRTTTSRSRGLAQADLFDQVTRVLYAVARHHPLVLVLDDLQWADNGSISLLFHLGRRLNRSKLLIVGIYRAEDVALGRNGERHPLEAVVHELERECGHAAIDLNQAEGQEFVGALLDSEPNRLTVGFRETLYRHTEGHALFTVELLRGLQERGDLLRDADGRWVEGAHLDWLRLPPRVGAVIAERIRRLPQADQTLLEVASVEGEEFTAEVVAQAWGINEGEVLRRLNGGLSQDDGLVHAQSLERVDGRLISRYRFRHHLFQTYLYHRLNPIARAQRHEQVGRSLEIVYGPAEAQRSRLLSQLAWHFEQAGCLDKAVSYRRQAGDQAMRVAASEEAIAHYMHGLALLANLPSTAERLEQEIALHQALSVPLMLTGGWSSPAMKSALSRAYTLVQTHGHADQLVAGLADRAAAYTGQAAFQPALELGGELLRLAHQHQNELPLVLAHLTIGEALFFRGELEASRDHLEKVRALLLTLPAGTQLLRTGVDIQVACLAWLAALLWGLGYPDQAGRYGQQALARASEQPYPPTLAFALTVTGTLLSMFQHESEAAEQHAEALMRLAVERDLPFYQAPALIIQGLGQVRRGEAEAGIAHIVQGLAAWEALGARVGRVVFLVLLTEAYRKAGQIEQGLRTVAEGLAVVEQVGLGYYRADLWRLKGEFLAHCGRDDAEVEACFLRAITIARQQAARLWELRATVALARLWQTQGRTDEARDTLAQIYGWFTEGLASPDLVEARVLLEELRRPTNDYAVRIG